MESDPICRRNNFAELHACVFQRLTKYPLLINSLIKQTHHLSNMEEELARLRDAEASSRDLLSNVNHDIRMWENKTFFDLVLKKCATLLNGIDRRLGQKSSVGLSFCRLDHRAFDPELRERDLKLGEQQLLRYADIYWRGRVRRDKKDTSYSERGRPTHLLLVFERYLVFVERSPSTASYSSAMLDAAAVGSIAHQFPTLQLRLLPVFNLLSAPAATQVNSRGQLVGNSVSTERQVPPVPAERPAERQVEYLSPIVDLAAVVKVTLDARGAFFSSTVNLQINLSTCKL